MSERDATVALLVVAEHDIDPAAALRSAAALSPRYYAPIRRGPGAATAAGSTDGVAVVEAAHVEEAIQLVMERTPGIPLLVMSAGETLVHGASDDAPSMRSLRLKASAAAGAAGSERRIPSRILIAGGWTATRRGSARSARICAFPTRIAARFPTSRSSGGQRTLSAALAAATRSAFERPPAAHRSGSMGILVAPLIGSLRVYFGGAWRDGDARIPARGTPRPERARDCYARRSSAGLAAGALTRERLELVTSASPRRRRLTRVLSAVLLAGLIAPHGAHAEGARPLGDTALPLPVREHLEYSIEFGVIKAGRATMTMEPADAAAGDSLIELTSRAQSSTFFSKFYPVDDVVRWSCIKARSSRFVSRSASPRETIARTRASASTATRACAIYSSQDTVSVPERARDVLSAFYDVRRHTLAPGTVLTFPNHSNKKTSVIQIKVLGHETIDTRVGRFRCIKVQPVMAQGGLFKNEGRIWVWFTDDDKRIPVKMESKLAFGAITVEIEKVERPGLRLQTASSKRREH